KLCKELGTTILISKSFVEAAQGVREQFLPVGRHPERRARSTGSVHGLHLTEQIQACCFAKFRSLRVRTMSGSGQTRSFGDVRSMSGLPDKAARFGRFMSTQPSLNRGRRGRNSCSVF